MRVKVEFDDQMMEVRQGDCTMVFSAAQIGDAVKAWMDVSGTIGICELTALLVMLDGHMGDRELLDVAIDSWRVSRDRHDLQIEILESEEQGNE